MSSKILASGHKAVPLEGEELAKQQKDFHGYRFGMVRLTPGNWLFPVDYLKYADNIYKFEYHPSDVIVMTYPKCGTTWTQEIVWTMMYNPNLDHPKTDLPIMARSPYQDMDILFRGAKKPMSEDHPFMVTFRKLCPGKNPEDGVMLQLSEATSHPRIIKSHLPLSLHNPTLLDTAKVIYVARNPKDVIVSYHHHSRLINLHDYVGNFQDFVEYFVEDGLVFGPYWLHVKEAWELRHHPNMLFIFFEDLKADYMCGLRKIDKFLGTNLSEEQLENVARHASFTSMKKRKVATGVNEEEMDYFNQNVYKENGGFFRKGESGDWKEKLNPEQESLVEKWTEEHMTPFGIKFKYSV